MVTIYTSPSCTSCRKAKAWLEKQENAYVEKNIFSEPLTIEEIKEILRMTEDGTDEIISERSNTFQESISIWILFHFKNYIKQSALTQDY